jgi:GntR family transcriptional regulator
MPAAPYERVILAIRERIASGTWLPGEQIPSRNALARELGISPPSVRRAMSILRGTGELDGTPRTRLFVAHPPPVRTLLDPDAPWPYLVGETQSGIAPAAADIADRLGLATDTLVTWERMDLLDPDQRPSHLVTEWWAGPRPTAWERFEAEAGLDEMTADESTHLGLPVRIPIWRVTRTRYARDSRPVATADLVLPTDRWRLRLR